MAKAYVLFMLLRPDEQMLGKMISAIEQQGEAGSQFPDPAEWLKGRMWEC
jgi:hypothetical protein